MFPIGDDDSGRRTVPLVTFGLIALNVLFSSNRESGNNSQPWLPVLLPKVPGCVFSTCLSKGSWSRGSKALMSATGFACN
jgi:hypothetical protein